MIDWIALADVTHVARSESLKLPLAAGKDRRRTRPLRPRSSPIWSTAGWQREEQAVRARRRQGAAEAVRDVAGQRAGTALPNPQSPENCVLSPARPVPAVVRAKLCKAWGEPDPANALASLKALAAQHGKTQYARRLLDNLR